MVALALRTIAAASVFAAILGFSRFSFGLLLPALMHELQGTYGAYGVIAAANFLGYVVGTAAVPLLLKRKNDARLWNAAALCAMALAMLLTSLGTALWQVGVLRFTVGVCSGVGAILTLSIALEGVAPRLRGLVSGGIWAGGGLGLAIAGALVDPHAAFTWRTQYALMAGASLLAAAAFSIFRAARPVQRNASSGHASFTWNAQLRRLAAAYGLFGFGYIVYMVFASSYRLHAGDSASALSLSWVAFGLGGAAGAIVWGKVFDFKPSPLTLCAALTIGAIAVLVNVPFMSGMSVFGTPAIVSALVRNAAGEHGYAQALSALTVCFGIGQIAGPLGAGFVIDHAGLSAGVSMTAVPLALAAVAACVRHAG